MSTIYTGYNDHDNYLSSQNVTYISHPLVESKMAVDILLIMERKLSHN